MANIHNGLNAMHQEWLQYISQEVSQSYLKYEVGDIPDEFWISTMWNIWRFFIPSIIWSHWSYYLWSYFGVGRQNKEVSLLKLHRHGEISFSHILHWSYLLMFIQQGRLCEAWREDINKKYQRHSKKALRFTDLVLLHILSGVKVNIWFRSRLRHIIFLGY